MGDWSGGAVGVGGRRWSPCMCRFATAQHAVHDAACCARCRRLPPLRLVSDCCSSLWSCMHAQSGKILGMQAVGEVEGVEKRVDVVAMAMQVRLAALGGESQGLVKLTAQPWVLAAWRGRGHGGRRGEVSSGCSALKSSNVCMVHRLMSRSEEGHTEERCVQCLPLPSPLSALPPAADGRHCV